MYAAGARKHEVWIAGRARVLASGVCVKRRVVIAIARAEGHGCPPGFLQE